MAIDTASNSSNEKTTTYDIDELTKGASMDQSNTRQDDQSDDQAQSFAGDQAQDAGSAIDLLRGSVVNVLDSVVREYEPQIAQFTSNIAHQAVDRGVEFASTAAARVQRQSWVRIGLAAALGIGALAILSYEASAAAADSEAKPRGRRTTH